MSIPTIAPTGALSSGSYVSYMADYLEIALTDEEAAILDYAADKIITNWYDLYDEMLDKMTTRITTLESNITSVRAQIRAIQAGIDKL